MPALPCPQNPRSFPSLFVSVFVNAKVVVVCAWVGVIHPSRFSVSACVYVQNVCVRINTKCVTLVSCVAMESGGAPGFTEGSEGSLRSRKKRCRGLEGIICMACRAVLAGPLQNLVDC